MNETDDHPVRNHAWLLVGGSLVVGYALGRRTTRLVTATRPQDDVAIVKAEIVGFLLGALWATVKQVVLPLSINDHRES